MRVAGGGRGVVWLRKCVCMCAASVQGGRGGDVCVCCERGAENGRMGVECRVYSGGDVCVCCEHACQR